MSCYPSATLHLNVAACNASVLLTGAAALTLGHLQTQHSCRCVSCCFREPGAAKLSTMSTVPNFPTGMIFFCLFFFLIVIAKYQTTSCRIIICITSSSHAAHKAAAIPVLAVQRGSAVKNMALLVLAGVSLSCLLFMFPRNYFQDTTTTTKKKFTLTKFPSTLAHSIRPAR